MCSWNHGTIRQMYNTFVLWFHNETENGKYVPICLCFITGCLWSLYLYTAFLWCEEKNISYEHALNFDQWKTFSENYKPMRVWLCLAYRFIENNCRSWIFSNFIQNQKVYSVSSDKISILTWKILVILSQNFSSEKNLLLAKYLISVTAALNVGNYWNSKPSTTSS